MNNSCQSFGCCKSNRHYVICENCGGDECHQCFILTKEEVKYFFENIKHEYLNKETYYFAIEVLNRMESFLKQSDELAGKTSSGA